MRRAHMTEPRRSSIPLICLALALLTPISGALGQSAATPADSGEDTEEIQTSRLEDKIPPVSGRMFFKNKRFELSPTFNVSFGDPFFQKLGLGLKADYHFLESLSLGLYGLYSFDLPSRAVSVCRETHCERPTVDEMTSVPGKLGLIAGLELGWTPLYGKLSLFAERVIHFDFGFTLGGALIQYQAPGGNTFTFGGHVGIGQRFFITPDMTLRIELRDYIYSGETVPLGNSTSKIENQIMIEIGLSFFLGTGRED